MTEEVKINEPAQVETEHSCRILIASLEDALYVIGGKWKLKIIGAMRDGTRWRFNELQRTVRGISARVLSNELKQLELNGFVKRMVHTETPVLVEYELTEYADSLKDVLLTLSEWGARHREKIKSEG